MNKEERSMANSNVVAAENILYKMSQLVRHDYEIQKRTELHAMGGYVERLHKGRIALTPEMLTSIARMQHMSSAELRQYIHHTNDAFVNNLIDNDLVLPRATHLTLPSKQYFGSLSPHTASQSTSASDINPRKRPRLTCKICNKLAVYGDILSLHNVCDDLSCIKTIENEYY